MLKKLIKHIIVKIRYKNKVKIDISADVSPSSSFEGMSMIHAHVKFKGHLGYGSYIGNHSKLNANIGRFTSIAPNVSNNLGLHPFREPYVSTAPCFYSLNLKKTQNGSTFADTQLFDEWAGGTNGGTIIENDCWIGEGAFLVGKIVISTGAVVLAHAVVTKDVPPYAIVGGVPAKIMGFRYDEETIQFLLESKWWERNEEWFKKNWKLLSNLESFKKNYYSTI